MKTFATTLSTVAAVAFTVLSWAGAFPVIRIALRDFDPVPLAALRFGVAALLIMAWLGIRRPPPPSLRDGVRFFICGAVGIALYNILLNIGQLSVSPGAASFIVNTLPVFTAILAALLLGEAFSLWAWAGTLLSFSGIAFIASGQPGGLAFGGGASLIVLAALCSAVYFVLQRPLVMRYGALSATAWTLLSGFICLTPWLPQSVHAALTSASTTGIAAVLFLGIFPAALGFLTWTMALGALGAARAANFLYLVPPTATLGTYVLTGEAPSHFTLIGGSIAIAGVIVVNTLGRRRAAVATSSRSTQ